MRVESLAAIFYEFCQMLDEIGHALWLDNFGWFVNFCYWTHRRDVDEHILQMLKSQKNK
jgi:hypothetical protein